MNCAVCRQQPSETGVLCDSCRERMPGATAVAPEQVLTTFSDGALASVIDPWGRPHPLASTTKIGRNSGIDPTLLILDSAVSRTHALIECSDTNHWQIRDMGSANGVIVNEEMVAESELKHGDVVVIGPLALTFCDNVVVSPVTTSSRVFETVRATSVPRPNTETAQIERTGEYLPMMDMQLIEPTGGAAGLVRIGGIELVVPTTQFELISILSRRMYEERKNEIAVRGFVRGSELIGQISWETAEPDENHLKQLVRRLRRSLERASIGDLVESRHRFGYRLRVMPNFV